MIATVNNMRQHSGPGIIAYSPETGERYSATPGDYFWMRSDEPLTDQLGNPLILARSTTTYHEVN